MGRDSYIANTNGGFYAESPVAEYQNTFVNRLRSYNKIERNRLRLSSKSPILTSDLVPPAGKVLLNHFPLQGARPQTALNTNFKSVQFKRLKATLSKL